MPSAVGHDGQEIYVQRRGRGPAILCYNADPRPPDHPGMKGVRDLRDRLVAELADRYTVVLMSYPGTPKPKTLTVDNVTADLLAIADAAEVDRFAWWGYSWGGVIGLQLALRSDRLVALAMTGFPPLDGPYAEMLAGSRALATMGLPEELQASAEQFATYYESLQGFDDRAAQEQIRHLPRITFVGTDDVSVVADAVAPISDIVLRTRAELESLGWEVSFAEGRDHAGGCAAEVVVPLLSEWLDRVHGH